MCLKAHSVVFSCFQAQRALIFKSTVYGPFFVKMSFCVKPFKTFSYVRFCMSTCFETEALDTLEMAYYILSYSSKIYQNGDWGRR